MITGLDHLVLVTNDINAGVAVYETLFGSPVSGRNETDGAASALFALGNTGLELVAPSGPGAMGDRVRASLEDGGERLTSLAFRVADIDPFHRKLERRNLNPEPVSDGPAGRRTRAQAPAGWGVKLFFLERASPQPQGAAQVPGTISGLDHVVVTTKHPERACALYGARLGLDMSLDRTNTQWGTRLIFFRCGDLVIEVSHNLKGGVGDDPDRLWGATWRVADIDAAHARMGAAGITISELRPGRKPGTRVFTVRDGTCGVPTLILSQSPRDAEAA